MASMNERLLVIGAGVNGAICAVGLFRAGFDVTLLARGQRFEDLQTGGIIIDDPFKNTRSITRVPLIDHLDPTERYDYILVVVRKSQVTALLPTLAQNISPNVVFMVNNASGPDEYISALGRDRVMLGFVFGAGRREGAIIHGFTIEGRGSGTPFGEVDGSTTPRLTRLVEILCQAGLHAIPDANITDWQATHAALVSCIAQPIMKHNLDMHALAKSKHDLGLMVDAMRETLDVLQAAGYRVRPARMVSLRYIPRFLLVALLTRVIPSRFMEVGAVWHVSQAPDEMRQLAQELEAMVVRTGLRVPSLRELLGMSSLAPLRAARHLS